MQTLTPEVTKVWLNSEPQEHEVIKQTNGSFTLPYIVIEDKLDFLTDYNWDTENFIHRYHMINDTEAISASILLVVRYPYVQRRITGACTYPISFLRDMDGTAEESGNYNEHYAATAKSLCIVNAAKCLGRTFGKYLNTGIVPDLDSKRIEQEEIGIEKRKEAFKYTLSYCINLKQAQLLLSKSFLKEDQEIIDFINKTFA